MKTLARRITPIAAASLLGALPLVAVHGPATAQEGGPEVQTVTNLDPLGWEIESDPIGDAAIGFVPAPSDDLENHPAPPGNLILTTSALEVDGDPEATDDPEADVGTARITNTGDVDGTALGDLTLEYSTLVTERGTAGSEVAPYLILEVELAAPATGDATPVPATLVFEPQYQGDANSSVGEDIWEAWTPTEDDAVWWSLTPVPNGASDLCLQGKEDLETNDRRCNWEEIKSDQSDATVSSLSIGIGDPLRSGDENWENVTAYADALLVGTDAGAKLYDFEHEALPPGAGDGHDAFALGTESQSIWRFDLSNPLTAPSEIEVEGIDESIGETLVGIDFHPVSGMLFGVTKDGSTMGRVYNLGAADSATLTAEPVTPVAFPIGTGQELAHFGVSFDPVADAAGRHLLNVVSTEDLHVAVDTESGAVHPQAPLTYDPSDPEQESVDPALSSLVHGPVPMGVDVRDPGPPHLAELTPPAGVLDSHGPLNGVSTDRDAGLDAAADGSLFAVFTPGSFSRLWRVDTDASATHLGRFGPDVVFHSLALPPTGTAQFENAIGSVSPGDGPPTVNVTRIGDVEYTGNPYGALTLDVLDVTTAEGGTAVAGTDYTLNTTQVNFPHGSDTSQPVDIAITRPAGVQGDVTVVLRLADPQGVGNFVDDPKTFTLTITGQEAAVIEFDAEASDDTAPETTSTGDDGVATLKIERSGGDVDQVSALLRVKETGAADEATRGDSYESPTAGDDYAFPAEGMLIEFPGDEDEDSVDVEVPIVNDTDFEGNEVATFELVEPSTGASIGTNSEFTLTIEDDDPGTVAFSSGTYFVNEGDSVDVVVERFDGNEGDTTVTVSDLGTGDAVPGTDYEAFGPLPHTFSGDNHGDTDTFIVPVQTTVTPGIDGERTIALDLSTTGSAALGTTNTATITILDRTLGNAFLVTDDDGKLASFDPDDPSVVSTPISIQDGAEIDIDLDGIDFRPTDQGEAKLYGVAVGDPTQPGATTQVYEIDLVTGIGTPVEVALLAGLLPYPAPPALVGANFGVDFDATDDTLRVVSDEGGHLVFDASGPAETWHWTPGTPFAYGPTDVAAAKLPSLAAVAHDQNVHPNLATVGPSTAYAIDHAQDALVKIGDSESEPPVPAEVGILTTVGSDLGAASDGRAGLDITTDGRAFAVLTDDAGNSSLRTIDLTNGQASAGSPIAGGPYTDLALAPTGVIRFDPDSSLTVEGEDGGEQEKVVTLGVERVGGTAGEVTFDFAAGALNDDATGGGVDYTLVPGSLTFADGSSAPQEITLTIHDDQVYEGDEDLTVTLSNLQGALFESGAGTLNATVTIQDDDVGDLVFDGAPFSVNEDEGPAQVNVKRINGSEGPLTVDIETQTATSPLPPNTAAASAGQDYVAASETLSFPHGATNAVDTFEVTIEPDHDEELDEVLDITLSNPSQGGVLPSPATEKLTILNDDDAGSVALSAETYEVSEDAGFVTVTLVRPPPPTGGSDGAITVQFDTVPGSADAGSDFTPVTGDEGRVTFGHGETTKTVAVPISDDAELEGDETFTVELTKVTDFPWRDDEVVDPFEATVTIRDAEPGSLFAVVADTDGDGSQELVRFDTARPGDVTPVASISGLTAGEQVVALDRRPADGAYYALGVGGGVSATLYTLDVSDGSLTSLGLLVDPLGNPFPVADQAGMAVDPVDDGVRIVDGDGQNLRVEFPSAPPAPLPVIENAPVWYANGDTPDVAAVAFTNPTAEGATQYDVDLEQEQIARQGDDHQLHVVGDLPMGKVDPVGFDIDPYDRVLATLSGSPSTLYAVEIGGSERDIGAVGDGLTVDAMAAAPSAGAIGFESAALDEIDEDDNPARTEEVTVQRTGGTGEVGFSYRVTDAEGNDVTPADDTRTLGDTDAAVTITVPVPGDDVYREVGDNDLQLEIYDITGGAEVGITEATLPVTDDDEPTVSITPVTVSQVDEGDDGDSTPVDFTISLSNPTARETQVRVSTQDGEGAHPATGADGDYTALDRVVTLAPDVDAAPSEVVSVSVEGDGKDEHDETFKVVLSSPDEATLSAQSEATVTIVDDDDPPLASVEPVSVTEGHLGQTEAEVPVNLSMASGKTVTVRAETSDGAATAGDDYVATVEDLTFDPGMTEQTFTVPVKGDLTDEPDETFTVTLSFLPGGNLDDSAAGHVLSATVTIVDDDDPPVVSVGGVRVLEGSGAAVVPVTLSRASGKTVKVKAATVDGTATAGSDYRATTETLTFGPGATTRTFSVPVLDDTLDEPDETFQVKLSAPVNVSIARGTGTVTIVDDDEPPPPPPEPAPASTTNSQSTPDGKGYWIATPGGDVFGFGDAERFGSLRGAVATAQVAAPVVDLEATTDGDGYWLLDNMGGVHTFGDARFFGSLPARVIAGLVGQAEATDMARTPDGRGYWVLDAQGGVHTFGTAKFLGSIPGRIAAGQDIAPTRFVSIAASPGGDGYTVLDEHGGVHTFGTAKFLGSIPGRRAAGHDIGQTRFVSLAATPDGGGYWILDQHGGVHTFGNADFHGSIPGRRAAGQDIGIATANAIEPAPDGDGYWIFDEAGGVFTFGSARFAGSVPGLGRG